MQKCPDCNSLVDDQAIFCDQCGFQLKPKPVKTAAPPAEPDVPQENFAPPRPIQPPSRSCPVCGYFNQPGEAYCTNCGSQLSPAQAIVAEAQPLVATNSRACPSCGAENPPGETYCQVCGFGLAGTALSPLPVQTPEQSPVAQPVPESSGSAPAPSAYETAAALPLPGRLHSPATDASLSLPAQAEMVIGRSDPERGIYPDVDLGATGVVPSSVISSVSRQHLRLFVLGNQVFIEDLNSTNSTFLNRQRLQPGQRYLLNSGDELRLGGVLLVFYSS